LIMAINRWLNNGSGLDDKCSFVVLGRNKQW